MLFNSYEFLLAFLPLTVALYYLFLPRNFDAAKLVLLAASLVFYTWWNYPYLLLILGSIILNYAAAILIDRSVSDARRRIRLIVACALNLGVLGYFKYMDFFIGSVNTLLATNWPLWQIVLPIGISFFTFQQIGFLIDVRYRRQDIPRLDNYALFVAFFPQLIAGPIVKYRELEKLFDHRHRSRISEDFAVGIAIIAMGLFKKVVVGDTMGQFADPAFTGARGGAALSFVEAWSAVLCFTVQIYCDFSGYSDMAIGLARMFRIRMPTNFYSPYQATSIIEFWRRWHITLSRFLRDALYIPLGGAKRGRLRRDLNLLVTMFLGGLWHGANWSFVAWGALHGTFLLINHRARELMGRPGTRPGEAARGNALSRFGGWALTFLCVASAWVLFRAESFAAAHIFFEGMAGLNGISLPADYAEQAGALRATLERLGITFAGTPFWNGRDTMQWLVPSLLGLWLLPNVTQLFGQYDAASVPLRVNALVSGPALSVQIAMRTTLAWSPNLAWFAVIALMYSWALAMLFFEGADAFIYFQF